MQSELLDKLERAGFCQYLPPADVAVQKQFAITSNYLFGRSYFADDATSDASTYRVYMTDAEDLAEGGVLDFFEMIRPFLERQEIHLREKLESFNVGGSYSVTVNSKTTEMYSAQECERGPIWELTTRRSFAMVNALLQEACSPERLYTLYGGNDLLAVFLTAEQYEIIRNSDIPEEEQPEPP